MSIQIVKDFLEKQFLDLEDSIYEIEEDENHLYVIFSTILDKEVEKEMTFKILNDVLYLHTITYGWKAVEKESANKYFWLELLNLDI